MQFEASAKNAVGIGIEGAIQIAHLVNGTISVPDYTSALVGIGYIVQAAMQSYLGRRIEVIDGRRQNLIGGGKAGG